MKKVLLLTGLAVLLAFCVVGAAPIEDVEAAAVYYNADLTAGFLLFTNTTDMAYNALNVVALQSIVVDEEKTLVFGGGEIIGIVPTMQNSFWTKRACSLAGRFRSTSPSTRVGAASALGCSTHTFRWLSSANLHNETYFVVRRSTDLT